MFAILLLVSTTSLVAASSNQLACPEVDPAHRCSCTTYKVTCDAVGASDLNFLRPFPVGAERLDVSHNSLVAVQVGDLSAAANVTTLSLPHNRIGRLDTHALAPLTALQNLDLSHNDLEEFDLTDVALPRLRTLDLSHNALLRCKLNPNLSSLRSVQLEANHLSDLDHVFAFRNSIDKLKLSGNNLGNNLSFLRNLPNVATLWLSENNISVIQESDFEMNKKLIYLRLDGNSIQELEFTKNVPLLMGLNLTSNHISAIPETTFSNMSGLQYLYLEHNTLSDTKFIGYASNNLISLSLSNNRIVYINPSHFKDKKKMNRLTLSDNEISDILFISNMSSMETLNLANNNLHYVSNYQFNNTKISYLDMSRNMIENMDFVHHARYLKTLLLAENKLSKINMQIFQDSLIESLDLSSNGLENIDFVRYLPSVKEILLANNRLSYLPQDIFRDNGALEMVNISKNSIRNMKFVFYASRIRLLTVSNCSIRSTDDSPLKCSRSVEVNAVNKTTTLSFIESTHQLWEECFGAALKSSETFTPQWDVLTTITMLSLICLIILLSLMLVEAVIRCRRKLDYTYKHIPDDTKKVTC